MTLGIPNYTIFIQFFFFLGTLFVLHRFVFIPVLRVIEERRKKTIETFEEAQALSQDGAKKLLDYQEKMGSYKDTLREMKEGVKEELMNQESEQIAKTREDFLSLMQETKRKIATQLTQAQTKLSADINEVSLEIFKKLVSRDISGKGL